MRILRSSTGSRRKQLGTDLENAVVDEAKKAGFSSKKQPMSGQLKDFPADAVIDDVLVECKVRAVETKVSGAQSVSLDFNWLWKVTGEAKTHGFRFGVVVLRPKGLQRKIVSMRMEDFLDLLKEAKR